MSGAAPESHRWLTSRNVFLIDGAGAAASAVGAGLILPLLQPFIGLPVGVLYGFAAIATGFALVSFDGHLFAASRGLLRVVFIANVLYVIGKWLLLLMRLDELGWLAFAYFPAETAVILVLVRLELAALRGWPS